MRAATTSRRTLGRAVASLQGVTLSRPTAGRPLHCSAAAGAAWRPSRAGSVHGLRRTLGSLQQQRLRSSRPGQSLRPSARRGGVAPVIAGWGDPVEFSQVTVKSVEAACDGCVALVVEGGPLAAEYKTAGQFVQMKCTEDAKPGFFAIASAPGASSELQFLVKRTDGTAGELCDLTGGAQVLMSAPMGKGFPVAGAPAEDFPTLLLFAAGTGISPLRALVESGVAAGRSDVRLYYGARDEAAMAYQERFEEWAGLGVQVVPCFSDPKGVTAANKGYVQDVFQAGDGIADPAKAAIVLCGMKGMTEAVMGMMEELGVPKDKMLMNF